MKIARWMKVAEDLIAGISDGSFPLNSFLPTEFELCKKYKVSRYTVRVALEKLTKQGFIRRWPRLGSKVISLGFDETYSKKFSSVSSIDPLADSHKRVVKLTSECIVDERLASRLECEKDIEFLKFSNVRMNPNEPDKPLVWSSVYVNPNYRKLPQLAKSNPLILLATLIEKEYGEKCTEVYQKISAVPLPVEAAIHLNAEPGIPSLRILRHYKNNENKLLEVSESYHPGNRFCLTFNMKNFR